MVKAHSKGISQDSHPATSDITPNQTACGRQALPACCRALALHQRRTRPICTVLRCEAFAATLMRQLSQSHCAIQSHATLRWSNPQILTCLCLRIGLLHLWMPVICRFQKASSLILAKPLISVFWPTPNGRGGDFCWRFPVGCFLNQTVSNRSLHHA